MELCRRGTVILDGAEKKVEMLLGGAGARRAPPRSRPARRVSAPTGIARGLGRRAPRGARSRCSRRASRRPPTAIRGGWSRRCATRCSRPASASGRCSALAAAETVGAARRRRAPRLRGRRARALLLAHPRRSARDGRRRLPARASEQPQGVRRGDRDPRGRRAADAGVRLDRGGGRARGPARGLPARGARARPRGGRARAWCAGRRAISASRRPATLAALETLHAEKTARAVPRRARGRRLRRRRDARRGRARSARFGTAYGVAFQHADDRDDAEHAEHAAERPRAGSRRWSPRPSPRSPPFGPAAPRASSSSRGAAAAVAPPSPKPTRPLIAPKLGAEVQLD